MFVGIGEEFAYRGYLQTRLAAWLGVGRGWIAGYEFVLGSP